jgi:DUF1680 family protein
MKTVPRIFAVCVFASAPAFFQTVKAEPPQMQAEPFDLAQVRLLEGPFKDAMERDCKYLLSLDCDRLLHTFRITAGLPTTAKPYGGWEKPDGELRGHTMGHYLSACSLMFASTGDAEFKKRADYLVAELAKCQDALPSQGCNKGFLSAYPESLFDRALGLKKVWAPFYTLHKIMAGLLDAHVHCGNRQALEVLVKLADWVKFRVDQQPPDQLQKMMDQRDISAKEVGGMAEVLANLSAVTGKREYLELARKFDHKSLFDPLARGDDVLDGIHANTQIPKIIGAAREYELTGNKRDRDIAEFFWQRVALHRSFNIGGDSEHERFFPVADFAKHLGPATAETCNTHNMLKLTRHLFGWQPTAEKMDFYERGLFNQILGSQDPQTGMVIYFASLMPGHFKTYCTPEDSFWCCTGTGMENHAKYGDTIYFHSADTLFVNLFIASTLAWNQRGVTIRQETKFPESDTTRLTVGCKKPVVFSMKIRSPQWAKSVSATVNGQPQKIDVAADTGYFTIRREWRDGDTVAVRLPMSLHVEPLPGMPGTVSILYGPIVLAGELGTQGLEDVKPYVQDQLAQAKIPAPPVPAFVCEAADLPAHIAPVEGQPLTFRTQAIGKPDDVTLIPYYRMHHQRFSVYWQLWSAADWSKKQTASAEASQPATQ